MANWTDTVAQSLDAVTETREVLHKFLKQQDAQYLWDITVLQQVVHRVFEM